MKLGLVQRESPLALVGEVASVFSNRNNKKSPSFMLVMLISESGEVGPTTLRGHVETVPEGREHSGVKQEEEKPLVFLSDAPKTNAGRKSGSDSTCGCSGAA